MLIGMHVYEWASRQPYNTIEMRLVDGLLQGSGMLFYQLLHIQYRYRLNISIVIYSIHLHSAVVLWSFEKYISKRNYRNTQFIWVLCGYTLASLEIVSAKLPHELFMYNYRIHCSVKSCIVYIPTCEIAQCAYRTERMKS